MIIGVLGLSLNSFNSYCRINDFTRVNDREYRDRNNDNTLIHIDNVGYLHGRHFDKIVDYDLLRLEANKRLSNKDNYYFGNLSDHLS